MGLKWDQAGPHRLISLNGTIEIKTFTQGVYVYQTVDVESVGIAIPDPSAFTSSDLGSTSNIAVCPLACSMLGLILFDSQKLSKFLLDALVCLSKV